MSGTKPTGRHQDNRLTAAAVRAAKEPGLYNDGQGLYLKVDPSGAKRWIQRIVIHGKRRDLGLGSVALVSLKEAREKALEQRKLARAGEDPLAAKRRSQTIPTFEKAVSIVHGNRETTWRNEKHQKQWLATLEKYAVPIIGNKRVDKIDSGDILNVLDPIWLSTPETASRVKQRIGTVLKWAIARGYRTDDPSVAVQQALPKHDRSKVKHMQALPYREVYSAIQKISESCAFDATKLAFEFLVHTACRSGEVRGALWSEINLDDRVWVVPAERMKMKRDHRVPLTQQTLAILERAKALKQDDCDLVFPSLRGKVLSDMTLSKLVREQGIDAVPHGFRSSFRDWAGEMTNHPHQVVEFALAHTIRNKVEAAYHRSDLLDKRKILMADWSDYVSKAPSKSADVSGD
ncbi:tyrosine-type recombinase/integrase [Sphingomonas sanguinis]|uniref:Tyrosine-type recombinase/integrase n=1 Tax=Sphingomonas sanguinis TaxID=33051 RepID=A0ABU5LLF9_9SPHN|nr:integrase arm-type DNA-binding domain-containing protein [Sphingomonas sanguinis]MDZ7280754.1 tyrosine-type recombinase/integrase [Sphingomonas sanguinis]